LLPFHERLALLSAARLDSINGVIGITVAGYFVDREFLKELAAASGVNVALYKGEERILATVPESTLARYRQTSVPLTGPLDGSTLSLVLLEDDAAELGTAQRNLLLVLGCVSLAGLFSIA